MILDYSLMALSALGIIYGATKKDKRAIFTSMLLLFFVAIVWIGYTYLYSKTPY